MTLYSGPICLESHRVRFMLAEKEIDSKIILVNKKEKNKDLEYINPHNSVPTLIDRDVILYNLHVIMEYLEERFPYPPLMPNDPIGRANLRLNVRQVESDWFEPFKQIEASRRPQRSATNKLKGMLTKSVPLFKGRKYFMNDEFTSLDCCMAVILWRIRHLEIASLEDFRPIAQYADRVFNRPGFRRSLTEAEAELEL